MMTIIITIYNGGKFLDLEGEQYPFFQIAEICFNIFNL